MQISIEYRDNIAILHITGSINIDSSSLIETVAELLKRGINQIIVDLKNVESVDYNGLSVLAISYKNALNNKASIKLSAIPLHVMELLRIVRLDNIFNIYKSIDDALETFLSKKEIHYTDEELFQQPLRRRFKRLDMDMTVYYRRIDGDTKKNPLCSGLAGNISGNGLFLRSINLFPARTELNLDIVLSEGQKPISAKGVVMWLADKQLQPDFYPGMGVQFADFNHNAQERLITFIEKNVAK